MPGRRCPPSGPAAHARRAPAVGLRHCCCASPPLSRLRRTAVGALTGLHRAPSLQAAPLGRRTAICPRFYLVDPIWAPTSPEVWWYPPFAEFSASYRHGRGVRTLKSSHTKCQRMSQPATGYPSVRVSSPSIRIHAPKHPAVRTFSRVESTWCSLSKSPPPAIEIFFLPGWFAPPQRGAFFCPLALSYVRPERVLRLIYVMPVTLRRRLFPIPSLFDLAACCALAGRFRPPATA